MLQEQIRMIREEMGMSLESLANLIYYTPHGLSQIETLKRGLKIELFESLLNSMGREAVIVEKNNRYQSYHSLLEHFIKNSLKESILELQEVITPDICYVQFYHDTQYDEIDVYFYDKEVEQIDLFDSSIYKDSVDRNFYIYDFLNERFYVFEQDIFKLNWKNQLFSISTFLS